MVVLDGSVTVSECDRWSEIDQSRVLYCTVVTGVVG